MTLVRLLVYLSAALVLAFGLLFEGRMRDPSRQPDWKSQFDRQNISFGKEQRDLCRWDLPGGVDVTLRVKKPLQIEFWEPFGKSVNVIILKDEHAHYVITGESVDLFGGHPEPGDKIRVVTSSTEASVFSFREGDNWRGCIPPDVIAVSLR